MWVLPLVAAVTCIAVALRRTRRAAISLRVSRWTYGVVMPLSLLYFPIHSGFRLRPMQCEWTFDWQLAIYSLRNTPHIVMMAIFFLLTYAQLPRTRGALAWSFAACFVMGFLVEIAEGVTRVHHCRMRDLIPDMTGACIGALVILAGRWVRWMRYGGAQPEVHDPAGGRDPLRAEVAQQGSEAGTRRSS